MEKILEVQGMTCEHCKAKLIYGADFCRITSLTNFSKIVSIFMKNTIMKI